MTLKKKGKGRRILYVYEIQRMGEAAKKLTESNSIAVAHPVLHIKELDHIKELAVDDLDFVKPCTLGPDITIWQGASQILVAHWSLRSGWILETSFSSDWV